jgi:hypothetical protein
MSARLWQCRLSASVVRPNARLGSTALRQGLSSRFLGCAPPMPFALRDPWYFVLDLPDGS